MGNIKDFERFLRQQLFREREAPLAKFVLRSAAAGTKGIEVESFKVELDSEGEPDDYVKRMMEEIVNRAQEDADGLGGVHHYVLLAYERNNPKAVGRYTFRVEGDEDGDSGTGEEGPNPDGMLKMQMRHNEALARIMTSGWGTMVNGLSRRLESQDVLIQKLMDKLVEGFEVIERARSEENNREIALLEAAGKEKRTELLFEKASVLFPVVLNRLSGKQVMDSENPAILMMRGLAESLSHEQIQKLAATLNMEQQITFWEVVKAVKPKQLQEQNKGG
jgi:hypothetical protein